MPETIIFIHGRNFKPGKNDWERLWLDAMRYGIERDFPQKLTAFDDAKKVPVYFGDISNTFLEKENNKKPYDINDRENALKNLKKYKQNQFTRRQYKKLPGQQSWREALADTVGAFLGTIGLAERLIEFVAPDIKQYWNHDSEFGSNVRERMIHPLKKAMEDKIEQNNEILVISHSLGTMISYDTFWKFSWMGEYRVLGPIDYSKIKIDLWLTLGSPLGDETVKRNLKGTNAKDERKYPTNVEKWINIRAKDDYISHDQTVANDYKKMHVPGSIIDETIYNLTVREGKSNPHSSLGFLVHPKVSSIIANWLR